MGRSELNLGRSAKIKTEEQKQKAREYARQWRINNPDKCREYHRVYAEKYSEKERERHRLKAAKRKLLRPKAQAIADKKWIKAHPEANRAKSHKRRVRIRNSEVLLILPKELKRLYRMPCSFCGTIEKITADHIIPIARGGRHSIGNLQALCLSCNASKNDRTITEWKLFKEKSSGR